MQKHIATTRWSYASSSPPIPALMPWHAPDTIVCRTQEISTCQRANTHLISQSRTHTHTVLVLVQLALGNKTVLKLINCFWRRDSDLKLILFFLHYVAGMTQLKILGKKISLKNLFCVDMLCSGNAQYTFALKVLTGNNMSSPLKTV